MIEDYWMRRELRSIYGFIQGREATCHSSFSVKDLLRKFLFSWHYRQDPPVRPAWRISLPLRRGVVLDVETVVVVDAVVVVDDRDARRHGDEYSVAAIIIGYLWQT